MAKKQVRGAQKSIHRRNLIYYMIYPYVKFFFFHYYGKVEIRGKEYIPRNAPVIFAPNHQNALMDALIVLFSAPGDMVFLARADIFNKRFLAWFLNSLKILPVFRQRDGAAELGKNNDIFDISVNVLKNRHYLCVMPEGNHGSKRRLRTIVKGIFRIAFKAQEEFVSTPFVKIVPVGLDFGDYEKQNTSLFINYGKPIEVSKYWEAYQENNARGINTLKAKLREDLTQQMIDIQNEEHYEAIHVLKGIYNNTMRRELKIRGSKLSDRFCADKELISRMEALIEQEKELKAADERPVSEPTPVDALMEKVERYQAGIKKMKIREWVVRDRGYNLVRTLWRYLVMIITSPLFLYGLINNALPYFLPGKMIGKIKDRQFHSSVKAGLGILILFPLIHGLQTILVAVLTWHIAPWIWLIYIATIFLMGKVALALYGFGKKTIKGGWFRARLRRREPDAWELVDLRKEIIEETTRLIGKKSDW